MAIKSVISACCPTCRQQFLNTRNVALEKVATEVKYPCVYRNYGYMDIYKLDLIGEHQQKCQYIPQQCPVNKLNIGHGNWTVICSSMTSHLKQAHCRRCMEYYGLCHSSFSSSMSRLLKSNWKWFSFTVTYITAAVRSKEVYFILFCSILVLLTMLLNISTSWNSLVRNAQNV